MDRKTRELLQSPHRAVAGAVRARARDLRQRLPRVRTVSSVRRYSIVSAVHDVAPYLDAFLRSLARQTLDFERHLEVILVDDGSRDRSGETMARWQARHPRVIRCLRQENRGQAAARNLGLAHATGDWITFADPDDLLDERYLERVDQLLSRADARDVVLVGCKMVFLRGERIVDDHALAPQLAAGDRVARIGAPDQPIQLSAASAFFRGDRLRESGLRFDETVRPNFEDGHFVGRFLLACPGAAVALASRATYVYRKRADASSTIDRSWSDPRRYGVVIERGYLDLLRSAAAASPDGRAPLWAQRTILYELAWYLTVLVDRPDAVAFLSPEERDRLRALLRACFAFVDPATIVGFEFAFCPFAHRVGMLGRFLGARPPAHEVLVDAFDATKGAIRMRIPHHHDLERLEITVGEAPVSPETEKERAHDLLGETFVRERIVWVRTPDRDAVVRVVVDGAPAALRVPGLGTGPALALDAIRRALTARPADLRWYERAELRLARSPALAPRYRDAFLFMDRDSQADDNAEHLYRYVRRARPDINAFFVLRRSSHDWDRLEREGARLLPFGSVEHRIALVNARHLVSSHAEPFVLGHPTVRHRKRLQTSRFTFLQHGVIMHDLSAWLNTKRIDCFVTASPAEHASIVANGSPYDLTRREVVLTGLPRHDALGAGDPAPERHVLVMPTWRRWLVGAPVGKSAVRRPSDAFAGSEFAARWKAFLHSPALREIAEAHGHRVRFFPHANLEPHLAFFDPPSFVEPLSHRDGSIQEVFRSAAVMITDYSSTSFEMAYLRRPVVYYQFDAERTFGGEHTSRPSYFDYRRDGFGPVCTDEASVLRELETLLARGCVPEPEHLARMERALPLRDGRACERVLDAILELDRAVAS